MKPKQQFIGRINSVKRYNYVSMIIFAEIFIFFGLLIFSNAFALISLVAAISSIIFCLLKIKLDTNVLLFDEDAVSLKTEKKIEMLNYDDIRKYEFFDQQRNQSFSRITFEDKKIDHVLDTSDAKDFTIEMFAEFILSKNETIEILRRQTNFETFKYFRNNNQIRKVLLHKPAANSKHKKCP